MLLFLFNLLICQKLPKGTKTRYSMFSFVLNKHCQQYGLIRKMALWRKESDGGPLPRNHLSAFCFCPLVLSNCKLQPYKSSIFAATVSRAADHYSSILKNSPQKPPLRSFPLLYSNYIICQIFFSSYFRGGKKKRASEQESGSCESAVRQTFLICYHNRVATPDTQIVTH